MTNARVSANRTHMGRLLFGAALLVMTACAIYAASHMGWIRGDLFSAVLPT